MNLIKLMIGIIFLLFSEIASSQICDIKKFLEQCPMTDPNIDTILSDFEIRLNGEKITELPCVEPVSELPISEYTQPLIVLQTLRTIYYMDKGRQNHLPWTNLSLYNWMKSNVEGINIKEGVVGGYCCEQINGKTFFVIGDADDFNREFDKTWSGISGNIGFYAHEVRHRDDDGHPHSSCCGISGGCDDEYDESNLGAYGIQYWLNKSWLTGYINVGVRTSCNSQEISEIINWHLGSCNSSMRNRFCTNIPDLININEIDNPLGSGGCETLINDLTYNNQPKLVVIPNPNNGIFKIRFKNGESGKYQIQIFNEYGQIQLEKTIYLTGSTHEMELQLSNKSSGTYFVKIFNEHELKIEKIMVK